MSKFEPAITGFLAEPRKTANGRMQLGRFACQDIQWTANDQDLIGTFTITAEELLSCAESNLLWTDQDVQRGIRPEVSNAPSELSLASGYPDPRFYIFDQTKADDIAIKLLRGERLFLNPLIWNLRPSEFSGFYDPNGANFYIYEGKIFLPDSHHRHQAILKAANLVRSNPSQYKKFELSRQFKIEIYFLSKESEGDYFYAKNQLPKPTSKSKAFDLTSEDDLSLLAKNFIGYSKFLSGNVNRVTDRLAANNADVITLSTLREMMRTYTGQDVVSKIEADGIAAIGAEFYDMLATVRPELGQLELAERLASRQNSLVDSAVMMHGYAYLMRDYRANIRQEGSLEAKRDWIQRLSRLKSTYHKGSWQGDYFSKNNPLWIDLGILRRKANGPGLSVVNNGSTRTAAGRALRALVEATEIQA